MMSDTVVNLADLEYIATCKQILKRGCQKGDRTGTGTISSFAHQMRFDLKQGFPILTTKSVHFKSVLVELLWFLRGDTNTDFLKDHNVKIWDDFAVPVNDTLNEDTLSLLSGGDFLDRAVVGEMYGHNWRRFEGRDGKPIDQIAILIDGLKNNPNSRRHMVLAWNPANLPDESMTPRENVIHGNPALPPCHYAFQCWVSSDNELSLMIQQRSADMFLGVPFNVPSYALLTHMLAQVCGMQVGELIWVGGDCHIYNNHLQQINTQIERFENNLFHAAPTLWLNPTIDCIDDFTVNDIQLHNYTHESVIRAPISV